MTSDIERLTSALADRYRLERELGQGGMATVYLAEDIKHHRRVAVKVLRPELIREAESLRGRYASANVTIAFVALGARDTSRALDALERSRSRRARAPNAFPLA